MAAVEDLIPDVLPSTRKARSDWRKITAGAGHLITLYAIAELAVAKKGSTFEMVIRTPQDLLEAQAMVSSGTARLVGPRPPGWTASGAPSDPLAQHRAAQEALAASDAAHIAAVNKARREVFGPS